MSQFTGRTDFIVSHVTAPGMLVVFHVTVSHVWASVLKGNTWALFPFAVISFGSIINIEKLNGRSTG